ncbi:hypothetical protein L198_04659 [Cryptococcus wingfieldii CBS 7118]|uniref:Uncharacterized protein n=1 Tax=Cryptococcus wingfieldii CBS 7118 TaxID=1295528 RepID=A0A1E3J342_9TREE|nr:hypothetical protein L198_04659 [Cryptococcus wingfieldii CBS 7118]ODN95269.1 hypothetical protein L198_04659 [Cryptococcus wingfieldii CBS 7118]
MSLRSAPSSPPPFFYPYDPDSPLLVIKGIISTATFGAATGASIGVAQSLNPTVLAMNMTLNMSIAGLGFFALREYIISPLLLSIEATPGHSICLHELQRRLDPLETIGQGEAPTVGQRRTERILDSALAGGLTGGVLSAAFRGRGTFGKAAFTSGLITSTLQLGVNQFRVMRLNYLAGESSPSPAGSTPPSTPPPVSLPPTPTFDTLKSDLPIPQPADKPSLPERMMTSLSTFLPVRKLTNQEYLETLEKKKEGVETRLKEIADEEVRMYEWADRQGKQPS